MSGGGSSGSQTTTSTQKTEPWGPQQPYLKEGLGLAESRYNMPGPEYYPGSTVVPFSPQTEYALQAGEQRALQGSPLNFGAQNLAMHTMNGGFLQGNPHFNNVAQAVGNQVRSQVDSAYAGAGRGPSAGYAESLGRGISDAISPYAFQNYENERGRQMSTMQMAPQMAMSDYNDIGMLGQIGAQREGQAQRVLGDDFNRFTYGQQLPDSMLDDYIRRVQGGYGSTSTTQQPYYSNGLATGIGGAMSGASTGYMIGGPWGAAVGGGLGLLGGFL